MPLRPKTPCRYPGCGRAARGRYCESHQQGYRPKDERPSAARRGYGARWRRLRLWFLSQHPVCPCGRPATEVDHIVPRRSGGTDEEGNLQAMCHVCHSRKTASQDGGFGHG